MSVLPSPVEVIYKDFTFCDVNRVKTGFKLQTGLNHGDLIALKPAKNFCKTLLVKQ